MEPNWQTQTGSMESTPYLTDWLLQVVSPDVDMSQVGVEFHSLSQSQQSLCPDVVPADRQPDGRVFEWVKKEKRKRASDHIHSGSVRNSRSQTAAPWGEHLAQVHSSLIFKPIERQVDDVQGRVLLQHLSQMERTTATHTVTAELQHKIMNKRKIAS